MMKRAELPEPKPDQFEYQLFREIYGVDWADDALVEWDNEEKITMFNYEKFIHPEILATYNTESDEFKMLIKKMNLSSKTRYEQHQANKDEFKKLMPLLSQLEEEEQRSLIHLL